MKKKWLTLGSLALCSMLAFSGCGDDPGSGSSTGGPDVPEGEIKQKVLDLGEDFNEAYYPKNVQQQQGKIDVAIVFEGTLGGWQAVAEEYSRLHSGAVYVNLISDYTSSTYPQVVNNALDGSGTDWDIIQGNLATNTRTYCLDMYSQVRQANPYAGNKVWYSVLTDAAYTTESSSTAETYLMNTEGLQTAWFVNTVALEAAGEKGYRNANNEVGDPVTWDDLINLCKYMEEAGYENPLGIALNADSIGATQFTWLLRVYGDYYYRNEYNKIATDQDNYKFSLMDQQPESAKDFSYSLTRLFNVILDSGANNNYVGGESAKFQEFVSQLGKMKNYLPLDAEDMSMAEMRTAFASQTGAKPQIMLDYAGAGLGFMDKQTSSFQVDYFDYPYMVSEDTKILDSANTLLRDVGGNGGYLSVVNHPGDRAQVDLAMDFMKFFMSPYGQTVYYNGLQKNGMVPMGLTTVVTDYVLVPEAWQEFFTSTEKITFTGLSDSNPFITFFIRSLYAEPYSSAQAISLWQGYLASDDVASAKEFGNAWHDALMYDWNNTYCKKMGYNVDCYKYPGEDTSYGG